jgi:hypothetical protein
MDDVTYYDRDELLAKFEKMNREKGLGFSREQLEHAAEYLADPQNRSCLKWGNKLEEEIPYDAELLAKITSLPYAQARDALDEAYRSGRLRPQT